MFFSNIANSPHNHFSTNICNQTDELRQFKLWHWGTLCRLQLSLVTNIKSEHTISLWQLRKTTDPFTKMNHCHLEEKTLLNAVGSDYLDSNDHIGDDEEAGDPRCCLFLCICPWNSGQVRNVFSRNGLTFPRRSKLPQNRDNRSVKLFHDPQWTSHIKAFYVNRPDGDSSSKEVGKTYGSHLRDASVEEHAFPEYRLPTYDSAVGSSAWTTGLFKDTNVLSKIMVEVHIDSKPSKWLVRKVRSHAKIYVGVDSRKSLWFLWKDQIKFYCVFGAKKKPNSNKWFFVTVKQTRKKQHRVFMKAGSEPAVINKAVNDQRFFKLEVPHQAPHRHILHHVVSNKYLSVDLQNRNRPLILVSDKSKATSWSFKQCWCWFRVSKNKNICTVNEEAVIELDAAIIFTWTMHHLLSFEAKICDPNAVI